MVRCSELEFLYLGDDNKFSDDCDNNFELITKRFNRSPSIVYIDRVSNESKVTEIGRCVIGDNWATPWLYIPLFEIAKPYRGQGYGKGFFYELMDFAQWKGFSYLWLNPKDTDKSSSIEFWRRMGGVGFDELGSVRFIPRQLDRKHMVFALNANIEG